MAKPMTELELILNRGTIDATDSNIHPDGKPWTKCCRGDPNAEGNYNAPDGSLIMPERYNGCQCACRRPPNGGANRMDFFSGVEPDILTLQAEGGRFFCIHRKTDDGYFRECAGWAAKYSKNRP